MLANLESPVYIALPPPMVENMYTPALMNLDYDFEDFPTLGLMNLKEVQTFEKVVKGGEKVEHREEGLATKMTVTNNCDQVRRGWQSGGNGCKVKYAYFKLST